MGSYVGIDLHRQRSVIDVLDDDGNRVSWCRFGNRAVNLAREITAAGPEAEVAMEASGRGDHRVAARLIAVITTLTEAPCRGLQRPPS